jgi:hypothetical protein
VVCRWLCMSCGQTGRGRTRWHQRNGVPGNWTRCSFMLTNPTSNEWHQIIFVPPSEKSGVRVPTSLPEDCLGSHKGDVPP